jgi:hypothetical protein
VFRGEPTKPLHEILLRLQYVSEYQYLTDGFRHWATTRSAETSGFEILSVIEFERIIEKIDNEAILDLSQTEFVALLDPLFAFFAAYDPDLPPESVPTEAVIIFLDDKGAVPISQALERMLYREELRTLTRSKLLAVIDDVLASLDVPDANAGADIGRLPLTSEASELVDTTLDGPPMHDVATQEHEDEVRADLPQADQPLEPTASSAPVPYVQSYVDTIDANTETEPEPTFAEHAESDAGYSVDPAEQPAEESVIEDASADQHAVDRVEPAPAEEAPTDDAAARRRKRLEDLLDDRMRDRVLKRVFARRTDLLDDAMTRVSGCNTWKEAATTLDRLYAEHGIEPNTAAAIEFSQAVYRSYLNGTP